MTLISFLIPAKPTPKHAADSHYQYSPNHFTVANFTQIHFTAGQPGPVGPWKWRRREWFSDFLKKGKLRRFMLQMALFLLVSLGKNDSLNSKFILKGVSWTLKEGLKSLEDPNWQKFNIKGRIDNSCKTSRDLIVIEPCFLCAIYWLVLC